MNSEIRVIKASFLAGISEIILKYIFVMMEYEMAHLMGYLGIGMILYSIWHGYYYYKEVKIKEKK